jgi:hypothetical protein
MNILTSLIILLLALSTPALATDFGTIDPATDKIAWDWTNVTKEQVAAWQFHCGPTSDNYTKTIKYLVPPQTVVREVLVSKVITTPGDYFCRMSVQLSTGEDSDLSNEISFTLP